MYIYKPGELFMHHARGNWVIYIISIIIYLDYVLKWLLKTSTDICS